MKQIRLLIQLFPKGLSKIIMNNKIFVGIDFGKKSGIAKANSLVKVAYPLTIAQTFQDVVKAINEIKPNLLIVGWPKLLSGKEGLECERVKSRLNALSNALTFKIDYILQDERFSSKFLKTKHKTDADSAAWILQNFLDSKKIEDYL